MINTPAKRGTLLCMLYICHTTYAQRFYTMVDGLLCTLSTRAGVLALRIFSPGMLYFSTACMRIFAFFCFYYPPILFPYFSRYLLFPYFHIVIYIFIIFKI